MKKIYDEPKIAILILSDADVLTFSNQGEGEGNALSWNDGEDC